MYIERDVWNGNILKELFEKSGISKLNVAKALNMNVVTLDSYMEAKRCPSLSVMLKLADFFAVPLDLLVGRLDQETYDSVLESYNENFMKLRRSTYEENVFRRKSKSVTVNSYTVDSPWPYNLLDAIVQHNPEKMWQDIVTEDQEVGLEYAISTLDERSRNMILMYFKEDKILEDCGNVYNVQKERARQIIAKAVRTLRHPRLFNIICYGLESYKEFNQIRERRAKLEAESKQLDELEEQLINRRSILEDGLMIEHDSEPPVSKYNNIPFEEMGLSVRSFNCLRRSDCRTIQDVIDYTKSGKLLEIRNLGRRSAEEILNKIFAITGENYKFLYRI